MKPSLSAVRSLSPIQSVGRYSSEYRSLLRLGAPVLVTQMGIITVSFADTMMVGAYGDKVSALASAAFVNSFFMVPIVMLIGFAGGMTPLIGALFSRKDHFRLGNTLRAGLQVNLMAAMALTLLLGIAFFFVDRLGQPAELLPLIRPYYLIMLGTLIPTAVFGCCQQTANGTTDTATPMWVILGCNALNILGNYMLIFGNWGAPELGLTGAGLSTLASRVTAAVTMLVILGRRRRYRPYREGWLRPGPAAGTAEIRRRVWTTSYPVMIQSGVECLLWSFGAVVSGWFGKVQLASYQVVNTIAQLGFMIFMSFGVATSIRVANYTGVADSNGVRRITVAGLHLNLLLATLASVGFWFFGHDLSRLFTPDTQVIAAAGALIPPLILYQYMDATQLTFVNALRGTAHVKPLLWISLVSYCAVGIPLLLALGVGCGLRNVGIYYSFSGALLTASVLLYMAFRRAVRQI